MVNDGGLRLDVRTAGRGLIDSITGRPITGGARSVTITGRLGPKVPQRAGLEDTLPLRTGSERAHLWGRLFGDEAAAGVMYAAPGFNKSWQVRAENTIANFADRAARAGNVARLEATVVSMPGTANELDHVVYTVWETAPAGTFVEGWTITLDREGIVSDVHSLTERGVP
jgi:hypothetical protein